MAVAQRSVLPKRAVKPAKAAPKRLPPPSVMQSVLPEVELPTEPHIPPTNIWDYTFLIYGLKKIGKTSLVGCFPNCLSLMFEPVARSLPIFQVAIPTWEYFLAYHPKLMDVDSHQYQTISIDTGSACYDKAMPYACKKFGFEHPGGQDDYGQSWDKVRQTFSVPLLELIQTGMGFAMVAHEKRSETTGTIIPALSGQMKDFVDHNIDNVFYYCYRNDQNYLQVRGDDMVTAGCAFDQNFLFDDGTPMKIVPMGTSSQMAYDNLIKAFNNQFRKEDKVEAIIQPAVRRVAVAVAKKVA